MEKLRKEDYSLLQNKVNRLLLLDKASSFDKFFLRRRVSWIFLKEYYSIKKLLRTKFLENKEFKICLKYMPASAWILYSIVFEISCVLLVAFSMIIYFMLFRFNCIFSFGVPISIAIVYFYNEFAKTIEDDIFSSIFSIQDILKKK
jgi:hypothetical protein